MENNCTFIEKRIEQMKEELEKINCIAKTFPDGELLCTKNSSRYKWYIKEKEGTTYLPKRERDLAENLAIKKFYSLRKQELENDLKACNVYLKKIHRMEGKAEQLLYHPEYSRLLEKAFIPMSEELSKWQSADYEKCGKHMETLIIKGTQGKMLRSKSEAIIDMMLYRKRIPFHYEEKLVLGRMIIYPDFVIRHPLTGEYYYWEHFGMMDEEEYRNHACNKLKLYCENGIIPSVNLITTFETKTHPLSIEKVEKVIQDYFDV